MKQPNSLVQISVNDVNLDSLSECAGQILAKEEAVLVIGGHLQHSSLLDKQKIYQALEPRLLLLFEGEADLCVNLQDYCCPLNFKTTRFPYPQRPSIGVADSFFEK